MFKKSKLILVVIFVVSVLLTLALPGASFAAVLKTPQSEVLKSDDSEASKCAQKALEENKELMEGSQFVNIFLQQKQKQCEVRKTAKRRDWQSPCDPRSSMPFRKDMNYYTWSPLGVAVRTERSQEILDRNCVVATNYRCVWARKDTYVPTHSPLYGTLDTQGPYYLLEFRLNCPDPVSRYKRVKIVNADRKVLEKDYHRRAPATLQEMAIEASAQLDLPSPTPYTWILQNNGGVRYTLVNGYTWFSMDPAQYANRSKRVDAGSTWLEVTAVPEALGFSANGEAPTWCNGPGTTLTRENIAMLERTQDLRPFYTKAPGGCSHRFQRTSPGDPDQPVTANMQIRWRISWVASGNEQGLLEDMYSNSTTTPFAITEAQTLVTR